MKCIFLLCVTLGLSIDSICQDSVDYVIVEDDHDHCVRNTTSIEELRQMKGYRDVHKIRLVSFGEKAEDILGYMPRKKNGMPEMSLMFETITLKPGDRDSILLILHNYANADGKEMPASCFEPRNGIIFYDQKDKIVGFIELCFGCQRYEMKWDGLVSMFCYQKWMALRDAFLKAGIKFGPRGEIPGIEIEETPDQRHK